MIRAQYGRRLWRFALHQESSCPLYMGVSLYEGIADLCAHGSMSLRFPEKIVIEHHCQTTNKSLQSPDHHRTRIFSVGHCEA